MRIFHKLFAALMAATFVLLSQNVQAGPGWPAVYDPLQLLTLNLNMDEKDWTTVKADTTYDIEVPAMFWADGDSSSILVSVRRKSADALGDKVSLKIDINEFVDQRWNGLKKLSLENGDDVDVVAEGFAWYLNRAAAAASNSGYNPGLAAWVKLYVNGEYVGVYINVEQPDKSFLKNRGLYTKNETWLYKAGDVGGDDNLKVGDPDSPTTTELCYLPFGAKSGGDTVESSGDTVKGKGNGKGKKGGGDSTSTDTTSTDSSSTGCVAPDSDSAMAAELNRLIDMEALLTLGAVSAFTMGPDDLFSKGKNFYYIDFLGGDKRLYTQWDLDTVFVSGNPDGSIYGTEKRKRGTTELSQTAYQEVILNNPTFKAQYDQILGNLLNGPLQIDTQLAFLNDLEVILTSALEADPNNNISGSVHDRFNFLREWASRRTISINEQLGN